MGWGTTILGGIGTGVGAYFGGPMGAAAGGAIGGALGSAIDGEGVNARNAEQAQMARDWQLDAMRSAHQREVHDLKEAGLNPIISAHNSPPIPNPATSQAIDNSKNQIDGINNAISGYQSAVKQETELKGMEAGIVNTNAQTAKTQQDTNLSKAQADKAKVETLLMTKEIPQAETKKQIYDYLNRSAQKMQSGAKDAEKSMTPKVREYFNGKPIWNKN